MRLSQSPHISFKPYTLCYIYYILRNTQTSILRVVRSIRRRLLHPHSITQSCIYINYVMAFPMHIPSILLLRSQSAGLVAGQPSSVPLLFLLVSSEMRHYTLDQQDTSLPTPSQCPGQSHVTSHTLYILMSALDCIVSGFLEL